VTWTGRWVARGHPAVTATHAKTFEVTYDAAITRRATCVVAVAAEPDGTPVAYAGPLLVTIAAGGESWTARAVGNPRWEPGGGAVVRRGGARLPTTFATDADGAAADVPRALAAALADPATRVTVEVTRDDRDDPVTVLAWLPGVAPERLRAEAEAADLVVAEDQAARTLLAALGIRDVRGPHGLAGAAGGRVLVVATEDLPGDRLPEGDLARGAVEVAGLPRALSTAVAAPSRAPVLLAGRLPGARAARLLRQAYGHRLVVTVPAKDVDAFLAAAYDLGATYAVVNDDPDGDRPALVAPGTTVTADGDVTCCVGPLGDDEHGALVAALRREGVPARTVARAVAAATGRRARDLYDLAAGHGAGHDPRDEEDVERRP
jgi:hypothetical protein